MRLVIDDLTIADVKTLIKSGKQIHGFKGCFEIPESDLKKKADGKKGFPVAESWNKTIEEISEVRQSKNAGKKVITVKWDTDYVPTHEHLMAFVNEFGIDCLVD